MIKVGETAPHFVLKDSDNTEISLKDLRGKFVLLLFYPRDNSPVCTKQMCEYRDNWEIIKQLGIEVFAINPASTEMHKNFKNMNDLPFPVLSDADSIVAKKYGAQYFFGLMKRAYVLISPEGKILHSSNEILATFYTSVEKLAGMINEHIQNYQNRQPKS